MFIAKQNPNGIIVYIVVWCEVFYLFASVYYTTPS